MADEPVYSIPPNEFLRLLRGGTNWFRRGRGKVKGEESHVTVHAGSFGGVIPRKFPTTTANIFTKLPTGNIGNSGIAPRIAARPNSASMLSSSEYYTQIPGIGILQGMMTKPFSRQTSDIHPAAVSDVTHLRGGVHPTTSRKVLQGDKAL